MESTKKSIEVKGGEVEVIDLDSDGFNPVMSGKDLLAFRNHQSIDEQANKYIEQLKTADHLVMIFPIWWELMPAMTKGFIDKVIFPGSAYTYTESGYGMNTLLGNIKTTTVITTMNTPSAIYKLVFGNAIKKALITGTLKKTGLKKVKWLSFNMVKSSKDETRAKWLSKVETRFSKETFWKNI